MPYRPGKEVLVITNTPKSAKHLIGVLHEASYDGYCVVQVNLAAGLVDHGRWGTVAIEENITASLELVNRLIQDKFPATAAWVFANSDELLLRLIAAKTS